MLTTSADRVGDSDTVVLRAGQSFDPDDVQVCDGEGKREAEGEGKGKDGGGRKGAGQGESEGEGEGE